MEPNHHLAWLEDNIDFFETITERQLALSVPSCPEWDVVDLLNHLSFGLGVCYPVAAMAPAHLDAQSVFADVDRTSESAIGADAIASFSRNLRGCLASFNRLDAHASCWTYAGPGVASFWFRRAAIETTIHRFDAEEALGQQVHQATPERLQEAIDETIEFAFPFAASIVGQPSTGLRLFVKEKTCIATLGNPENPSEDFIADRHTILRTLWGRKPQSGALRETQGQQSNWFSLIERAFAGR